MTYNQDVIYQDVLIANAQKKIDSNNFTSEKKITFMEEVSEWVDKAGHITGNVDVSGLEKLSTMIEKHIAETLDKEKVHPVRFKLHKEICISASKLMQHCAVWKDSSIERLMQSVYLTNE